MDQDVPVEIPAFVINCFDKMLSERSYDDYTTIDQRDIEPIIKEICRINNIKYDCTFLEIEQIYKDKGWIVDYCGPPSMPTKYPYFRFSRIILNYDEFLNELLGSINGLEYYKLLVKRSVILIIPTYNEDETGDITKYMELLQCIKKMQNDHNDLCINITIASQGDYFRKYLKANEVDRNELMNLTKSSFDYSFDHCFYVFVKLQIMD
jgi:hypothetical protein